MFFCLYLTYLVRYVKGQIEKIFLLNWSTRTGRVRPISWSQVFSDSCVLDHGWRQDPGR